MKHPIIIVLMMLNLAACKQEPTIEEDMCAEMPCGVVQEGDYLCFDYAAPERYEYKHTIKVCTEGAMIRQDTALMFPKRSVMMDILPNTFSEAPAYLLVATHLNLSKFSDLYLFYGELPEDSDLLENKWFVPSLSRAYSLLPELLEFKRAVDVYFPYDLARINSDWDDIYFPREAFVILKVNAETREVEEVLENVSVIPTSGDAPFDKGYIKAAIQKGGHYLLALPIAAMHGTKGGQVHLLTSGARDLDKVYSNNLKGGIYLVPVLETPYTVIQIDFAGSTDAQGKAYIRFEGNKPGTYEIDGDKNFGWFFYQNAGMKDVKTLNGQINITEYGVVNKTIKGSLSTTVDGGETENGMPLKIDAEFEVWHTNPW